MNTLITGVSGSGKTSIAAELSRQGYDARNMDSIDGLCSWVDLSSGKSNPDFKIESADDWVGKYDWLWDEQRLKELLCGTRETFFCGSSGNERKFFHLFGKVFLLEMDEQLIRDRVLNSDRDHDYGKMPGEIDAILGYYEEFQDEAKALGAIVIDAKRPISGIIKLILDEALEQ